MKSILVVLLGLSIVYTGSKYSGNTMAPVILAGSIVKHKDTEIIKKYPRKKCPVCKGTGKYLSGDTISWVDCGYCEPEASESLPATQADNTTKCKNPNCKCRNCTCKNCGCVPSVE